MAKKDKTAKPAKEKKPKPEPKPEGDGAATKRKSDKDKATPKRSSKTADQEDHGGAGEPPKSGSIGSKDGHHHHAPSDDAKKNSKLANVQEWNSETVRNANLIMEGFSCCIVLVMEDSPELSKFGEFLLRAVETGVRRKFNCISGAQTAERVKRFMASRGHVPDDQSHMERQDLFAEAIKCTLLAIKDTVASEMDADHETKELELAGARSKDLIRYVPPLKIPVQGAAGGGDIEGDEQQDGIREPPPAPPPTVQGFAAQSLPKKKGGASTGPNSKSQKTKDSDPNVKPLPPPPPQPIAATSSTPSSKMGVKTRMRKRGEVPMPEFELIDDSPPKGPRSYVLLQGFYNPRLIDELTNIGVKIDGILLMTDAKVNRYNFSIMDVEDSIPGTFRPKNALPQYLKAIERLSKNPETRDSDVTQFWTKLTEMYNSASTESPFHDIALMNFPLPESKKINLESSEGITYYISKVYDEVAKRIYEMLVLEEWFQEFTSAADVTQLQPLEPVLPHEIYDLIVGQIPSECITVPIILEALVQQVAHSLEEKADNPVPQPCYEENSTAGIITGESSFGSTNWGLAAPAEKEDNESVSCDKSENDNIRESFGFSSLFKVPMYIKSGDYASIRSCHLNESLASKIASCQLSGDMRNIRGFLWQQVPEFNKGLYMKLLGNLNHFLYFMPPDMIQFEDMFYILHLLMSAGIEVHLQKEAALREKPKKSISETNKPITTTSNNNMVDVDANQNSSNDPNFPGTNLSTDHNYFAVSNKTGVHLVITPTSNKEVNVAPIGRSTINSEKDRPPTLLETFVRKSQAVLRNDNEEQSDSQQPTGTVTPKKGKKKNKDKKRNVDQSLDVNKAARVAAVGAIQSAGTYAQSQNQATDKAETEILEKRKNKNKSKGKKGKAEKDNLVDDETTEPVKEPSLTEDGEKKKSTVSEADKQAGGDNAEQNVEGRKSKKASNGNLEDTTGGTEKKGFSAMNYPSHDEKRFIACEEQWFEDIQESSVIQALLECPALLAINESGALDLSKWIEKYLLSTGMETALGDGVLLGDLKNWNYVEELVPIQTVQMLNEASQDYLSMQRMYCPFYDTLLFIFNNPMPKEMTAESQFYFRLKTLPGLQHFLEYTMDDQNVLRWIEQLDTGKRLETNEQTSINSLLSIIPEEQWLMVPSIKYQIMIDNLRSLSGTVSVGSIAQNGKSFYGKIGSMSMSKMAGGNMPPTSPLSVGSLKSMGTARSAPGTVGGNETAGSQEVAPAEASNRGSKVEEKEIEIPKNPTPSPKTVSVKGSTKTAKSEKSERKSESKKDKSGRNSVGSGGSDGAPVGSADAVTTPTQNAPDPIIGEMDRSLEDNILIPKEKELIKSTLNFTCYDLGKRVAVVGNDTFFLFPMDGTVIRYEISTIEPEFRMMQLTVTKNGHQTFFYPYYIPQDFDLSMEDYVVCPYFHMVLANGTICAFQDLRAEEAAPYLKIEIKKNNQDQLFSFEKVLFGKEVEKKMNEASNTPAEKPEGERLASADSGTEKRERKASAESKRSRKKSAESKGTARKGTADKPAELEQPQNDDTISQNKQKSAKKGVKDKKSKKQLDNKSPDVEKKKDKKGKKKGKGGKYELELDNENEAEAEASVAPGVLDYAEEDETGDEGVPAPPPTSEASDALAAGGTKDGGEWMYPSSENSDDEAAETQKRRLFFAPPWDDAVHLIQPMAHAFTITLPSGLMACVEDLAGPPLSRIVKQYYVGHGSARSNIEGTRYYTMDGSVIKFLLNGSIQILTARGVTTTIDELAANAKRDTENISTSFGAASVVKIFNGKVILPNGQLWEVVNGKKESKPPIYVFTSGPLSGGEVFRRRQDGVVYLHRYDGTVITHYPDGTRFTTRMVILEKNQPSVPTPPSVGSPNTSTSNVDFVEPEAEEAGDEEFSDWVFVGLKYMIEHPNYSTVLFNTLSGNVHLKLPHGEWVRVFADGNVRISTEDQYCLDVDKNRALLSYPPCVKGSHSLPNMTTVRLWHAAPPGQPKEPEPEPVVLPVGEEGQNAEEPLQVALPTEPPTVEEKKEEDNVKKKETKKNLQNAKNLHPKVKQAKSRARATRLSNTATAVVAPPSKTPVEEVAAVEKVAANNDAEKSNEEIEGEGGAKGEGDVAPDVPPPQPEVEAPKPSLRQGCEMFNEFLQFNDETTFCKSVDSWDNRFLMNVYGGTAVDKVERDDAQKEVSTQQLIETLSEHSHLPKKFISGILKNTSSENLETAARRIQALRKGYRESCNGDLPNTKIFVVKRDLTAFQYLQKSQVNEVVTKAYSSRESMVIVDPVPKRQPRRYVTIMRPVEEATEPHGMWTRPYIEPMFRPRGVTNKHLKVATPNDLRWFGYILNAAHGKRPKFVPEPKDLYKEKKLQEREKAAAAAAVAEQNQTGRNSKIKSIDVSGGRGRIGSDTPSGGVPPGDDVGKRGSEEEGYSGEEEEEGASGEEAGRRQSEGKDDKKNKKKDKKEKEKEKEKDAGKKGKGKDKRRKTQKGNTSSDDEEEEDLMEDGEWNEEEEEFIGQGKKSSNRSSYSSQVPEIDEYPNDIEDLRGIYEMERELHSSNFPKISAKEHSVPCNTKKALVVRAFVEIPKVDENMQRALLAASMSYAETCKTEAAIYKTYKTEDPRSREEKDKQTDYKQQMIEQNIDEMHLLEQRPGPVLRFHF